MPGLQLQYYAELRPPFPCKVSSEWEPADRKSAALRLILKGLLSALVAFPTSIKLKSRLFSTCNQLIRICRIPDEQSVGRVSSRAIVVYLSLQRPSYSEAGVSGIAIPCRSSE